MSYLWTLLWFACFCFNFHLEPLTTYHDHFRATQLSPNEAFASAYDGRDIVPVEQILAEKMIQRPCREH